MRLSAPLVLAAMMTWLCAPATSQESPSRYSIKEDAPQTGYLGRHEIVSGSALPFDKSYAELTADQQALLKSQYQGLGPTDEPPYPLHGLGPIFKAIAKGQTRLLVEGNLSLQVDIDSQGNPTSIRISKSPDSKMTQYVAAVLMEQKFKPALCGGVPCKMSFPFDMNFALR